jgi:preprotein translocase subunit SecG
MPIYYYFLTALLFLDCVILVMLVLLQLPKKEAGAGMAFGGGATDALFGAGSGNVLTKITKYAAGIFFGLALIMAMISSHRQKGGADAMVEELSRHSSAPLTAPATAPVTAPANNTFLQTPLLTNVPTTQAAPAPAPASKTAAPNSNK